MAHAGGECQINLYARYTNEWNEFSDDAYIVAMK